MQSLLVKADGREYDPATTALVAEWVAKIDAAEAHWKPFFKQMKENTEFAAKGADKKWVDAKRFRVPILNRHINQSVSALYARNPRAIVTRRKQLMFVLWDGRSDTLSAAMELAASGDQNSIAILQEVQSVLQRDLMLDRMAKSVEIAWDYFLNEQSVNYKKQIKAMVRRAKVCGVAYVKLVFQRALKLNPETVAKIEDTTSKLAEIERLLGKQETGELQSTDADAAKLRAMLADLRQTEYIVAREGPILDFPKADRVIIDPEVIHLSSLTGANWITFPYDKTCEEIEKLYHVELGDDYAHFIGDSGTRKPPISAKEGQENKKSRKVRTYEVWDKETQQKFVICRGYNDFLEPPAAPKPQLSRFWPLFPLVFNEVEHDELVIPPSDVEQAKDIQNEYNRSREGLRQHRIASRPYYVEAGGLTVQDKEKLGNHQDHEVISLSALAPNQDVEKLIMRGPTIPIDPNLYEVEPIFKDLQRAVGTQEANLGGNSSRGTATESSIAENSRSVQTEDNVDDLDEMLTELSIAGGEMLLMELSKETAIEIIGPGAVWPDHPVTRTDAAKHLLLTIEAGSSGRPNQAAELAKMERATPFFVQVPGINPAPLAKRYGELLDLDTEELIAEGAPSITAINAIVAKNAAAAASQQTGDPMTDPAAQGGAGGQNAPVAAQEEPGPQPAFPAPL